MMKIHWNHLLRVAILLLMTACTAKEGAGTLFLPQESCYVSAGEGRHWIALDASTAWRVEYPSTSWIRTDLRGGRATTKGFYVIFDANPGQSLRYADLRIFTVDRNAVKTLRIMQYPRLPRISFASPKMTVRDAMSAYTVGFESTVANEHLTLQTDVQWIALEPLGEEDTQVSMTIYKLPSTSGEVREGNIILSYSDEYGREAADTLLVRQINAQPDRARSLTFAQAQDLLPEEDAVAENYYVEGFVTADGKSDNYRGSIYERNIDGYRYIIENEGRTPLIFESSSLLDFDRSAKVRLWLLGLQPRRYEEGNFAYYVFQGLDESHVLSREAGEFAPREITPGEVTPSLVFTWVKLKEVEISPLHGAFTNFKETSPSSGATSTTHTIYKDFQGGKVNWKKSYPEYFRFFPTLLRGKDGRTVPMYIAPTVSYAHESYPTGGGSVTGILVREVYTNFDIDEATIGIRPLERSDIDLSANREEGITSTLVDFELNGVRPFPGSSVDASIFMPGTAKFLPGIQQTTSDTPCTFTRSGATAVARYYSGTTTIGFQDKFRGDVNTGLTDGNTYRSCGISTQVPSGQRVAFLLEHLCTKGITSRLSLQIEVNSNRNLPGNPPRARVWYSLDGQESWTVVESSDIKFLSQFDRDGATETGYREPGHIPGMKYYDITLPDEICDKEDVTLKIEQTAFQSATKVLRVGNVTVKYDKP